MNAPERSGEHVVVPAIIGDPAGVTADRALTRLHAHEMAVALRAGRDERHRAAGRPHGAHRDAGPRPERVGLARPDRAPGPPPQAADARLAAARAEGPDALAALPPLLGIPVALKDLVVTKGRPSTAGSRILRGFIGPLRRAHRRAPGRRGRRDPGQDEHGRVRDGLVHGALRLRPHQQPLGPRPGARRLVGRLRRGGGGVPRAAWPSARTPAARSASRRRSPASWASSPPTGASAATASSRSPPRSTRWGRSRATCATPRCCWVRSAAATTRDSTSSPQPVPDYAAALPVGDDEAAATLRGMRLGLPRQYFVPGMDPGVEARVREAVAALAAAGARDRGRGPAAHRLRSRHLLHHRAGGGVREPRALRRHPVRALRARRATCWRTTSPRAGRGSGRR